MRADQRARAVVAAMVVVTAVGLAVQGWLRFATFHNETFDLAFYAHMAWGPLRGNFWEPIVGAHFFGLHISWVMFPLGLLSFVPGLIAPALLATQAAAISLAAIPFARMAERRFGPAGGVIGAAAFLLYPNVGHVATFEFHPGTLAVLPLAFALEALDREDARAFALAVLGVLACREDLGLSTALLGLVALRAEPLRRVGAWVAGGSVAYVALFVLVILPQLGPPEGSVQLHFGKWGTSLFSALLGMLSQPIELLAHLAEPARLSYLPRLLLPLALLPLGGGRFLIPALPLIAINLLSDWPTTTALDSHYQTTILPFLVAGAIVGAERLSKRLPSKAVGAAVVLTALAAHGLAGGTPLSADFDGSAYRDDPRSDAAREVVEAIGPDASVQAPYALLPHLAERNLFGPPPPPDRNHEWVVFDTWHRERHAHDEDLLRTTEEPTVRNWLARDDYGLVRVAGPYLLLRRGEDPRAFARAQGLIAPTSASVVAGDAGVRLAACLSLARAERQDEELVLTLVARGPCGSDLALRLGRGRRPARVDLLFSGLLSPALLREGDRLASRHVLDEDERRAFDAGELRVGLLRSSGARPEHGDPVSVYLPISRP